jgi:hypothetical protein
MSPVQPWHARAAGMRLRWMERNVDSASTRRWAGRPPRTFDRRPGGRKVGSGFLQIDSQSRRNQHTDHRDAGIVDLIERPSFGDVDNEPRAWKRAMQ